jgi:hypothetical protein
VRVTHEPAPPASTGPDQPLHPNRLRQRPTTSTGGPDFLQDIGAFQIGLGAVLLLAVAAPRAALAATLLGVGIGSAAHAVSHVIGRHLGGTPASDIPLFTFITLLLLVAGAGQWRSTPRL